MTQGWNNKTPSLSQTGYYWWLTLICLVGVFFRLHGITDQIMIDDEWHALNAVQHHNWKWILTHFGKADHSIPLALLYEFQYQLIGLSELAMRWPMLLTGCLAIWLIPHMMRHWLRSPERLLLATLLAISPLLIYYSRFARPYSILVLLESGALLMAWHWWKYRQIKYAIGWVALAGLATWLNIPALIIVTAPFVYLGFSAVRQAIYERNWIGFWTLFVIGLVLMAILAVLIGPAIATQSGALVSKAGRHYIDWSTLPWALSLASGSGHVWVYVPMAILALLGFVIVRRHDAGFAYFILVCSITSMLVLQVTGAAAVVHGNVFLRYTIGIVPFYLAFFTVGLMHIATRVLNHVNLPTAIKPAVAVAGVCALFMAGPIPEWPLQHNQFITHQNYHFHYDWQRNLYSQAMNEWYQPEVFYEEIAALHEPGAALIVEAPWYMESYFNPLNLQQEVHRQRVQIGFINGLCAGPLYGEITAGQEHMQFKNFIYLQELLDGKVQADYIVLRHRGMPEVVREIEMDFAKCEAAIREKYGEPWRESAYALVFKL